MPHRRLGILLVEGARVPRAWKIRDVQGVRSAARPNGHRNVIYVTDGIEPPLDADVSARFELEQRSITTASDATRS